MTFKHPHRYGLMAMVRKKDYDKLDSYQKELDPLVKFYMKPDFFDDIAPQHISMCYFSYPAKYPQEYIEKLVPAINKIAERYLPMKVRIKGLLGAWEVGIDVPAILWNITNFDRINDFHEELINALKNDIEHFNDPEMDYTPHIGIALGDSEKLEEIKNIIAKSKDDEEQELIIDRLDIFFPDSPKTIFDVNHSK